MNKTELLDNVLSFSPQIDPTAFIAAGTQMVGNVTVKGFASIWYNCVLRGDINAIEVGEKTNIQDGSILHVENARDCRIGNYVTVGHGAILHACTIQDGCLIGMGAIVLSGAVIKRGSIVGAGTLVKEGEIFEENSLIIGIPAKRVKDVPSGTYDQNLRWAEKYAKLAQVYLKKGQR